MTLGTLAVVGAALVEVRQRNEIGLWTGVTLCVVAVVAAAVTRPGDRSLPVMMPPLAFAVAVLIAGQSLVSNAIADPWKRQAAMIVETLGRNAIWVVTATVLAFVVALIGHLVTRSSSRSRSAQ